MTFNADFKGTPLFDVEYLITTQDWHKVTTVIQSDTYCRLLNCTDANDYVYSKWGAMAPVRGSP